MNEFKKLRKATRKNQEKFGRMVGTSASTISAYEKDLRWPSQRILIRMVLLARELKVDFDIDRQLGANSRPIV